MAENIGLEGQFDLDQWDRGVSSYLASIDNMNKKNANFIAAAGEQYANLGGIILKASAAAATAAVTIGAVTGKAIIDWTAEGISKATDLEAQISDIAAVLNTSRAEVAPLADLIGDLALDPKLKVTTTQAADAIAMLARNGVDMDKILGGAARATALLANSTNDDFALAADVATDSMVLFNKNADEMGGVINSIVGFTQASKFDINDYALALAQAGGVAGSVGVDFDDFNAMLGATSSSFASGSDAGTSFKTFLQSLIPDTNKSADAMRDLGLFSGLTGAEFDKVSDQISKTQAKIAALDPTSKNYATRLAELNTKLTQQRAELVKGGSAFFDANGKMKSGVEIADALATAFSGLSDAQRISAASAIFGTDAMRTGLALADAGGATVAEFKKVLGDTSAEDAAATRMDNLSGAMEILFGIMDAIQTQVGQQFQDVLKEMAQTLSQVLEGRSEQIVEVFGTLAEWAGEAAAQLLPLAVDVLPAIIDNLIAVAQWAIEVGRGGDAWNEWLEQMDPALRTWMERLIHVSEAISLVNSKIGEIVDWIGQVLSPITDFIASFASIEDVIIAAGLAVAAFLAPMALAAAQMAAVGAAATLAVAFIRDAWETNLGGVRDFVAQVWVQIQGIVATGAEIVQTLWSGHGTTLSDFATRVWETIQGVISGALNLIQGVMNTVLAAAQGDWTTVWENIANAGQIIWETIKTGWNAALAALTQFLTDHWPTWSEKLAEWGGAAWQWIVDVTPIVVTKLGEWAGAIWDWVITNLPTWIAKLGEWATAAWQWIVDAAAQLPAKLGEWYAALSTWVTENLPAWQTQMAAWGTAALESLKPVGEWMLAELPISSAAAQTALDLLGDSFAALDTDTGTTLENTSRNFDEFGKAIIQTLDAGLGVMMIKAAEIVGNLALSFGAADAAIRMDWDAMWKALDQMQANSNRTKIAEAEFMVASMNAIMKMGGQEVVKGFAEGMELNSADGPAAVGKFVDGVNKEMTEGLDIHSPSGKFAEYAEMSVEGFRKGFIDNITYATEAATQLTAEFLQKFDIILSKLPLVAKDSMVDFVRMFRDGMDAALRLAADRSLEFLRKFDIIMEQLPRVAQDSIADFGEAMRSGNQMVLADAQNFVVALTTLFGQMAADTQSRFEAAGQGAGAGFVRGLDSMIGAAQAKVTELGNLATQALSLSLEAQSPSRKFMVRGEWAGEGFVEGLDKTLAAVQQKAVEMAQVAVSGVQGGAGGIASTAIAPTFDLGSIDLNLNRLVGQQLADRSAVSSASSIQSYATANQYSNTFGPNYISTAMDWAEMEFRMRRILAESI